MPSIALWEELSELDVAHTAFSDGAPSRATARRAVGPATGAHLGLPAPGALTGGGWRKVIRTKPPGEGPRQTPREDVAPIRVRRAVAAELAGTLLLVLVAAGGPTIAATGNGPVDHVSLTLAPGLTVMALIYALGGISGAHFNPVVTLTFSIRGDFPWRWVPEYLLAQLAGALIACLLLRATFGLVGHLGTTMPGPRATPVQALIMEIVLTNILVLVVLGTALGARNVGHNSALAVGGYIAAAGLFAGTVSGASLNPTRSLAPALVSGRLQDIWIYLAGPLAGAVASALAMCALDGRATATERDAAFGEQLR